MKREHAKALLPFITAYAEGKTIQFKRKGPARAWADWDMRFPLDLENREYRINPEPKLAPMTSDDLPPVFWIRYKGDNKASLITAVYDDGTICWGMGNALTPGHFGFYEWSPDRKIWHSLMKEVTE